MKKTTIKTSRVILLIAFLLFIPFSCNSKQNFWKSKTWNSAVNITDIMDKNGITELSGLHWNPSFKRLYAVQDNGKLKVLQMNKTGNAFSQIANISDLGGPEGIMQVDYNANEFYTIDENSYQIRRYTHNSDFQRVTLANKWNLLISPSLMPNSGNDGPEGIEFVPDKYLKSIGFISSETDEKYISTKGMGGLIFIAHQKKGYVWVFDVNPNKDDDYAFVGKYKTNQNESCDLAFDRSTGLLYILHNTENNTLEVTDLSTELKAGKRKFITKNEYEIPNPSENTNIEGFAITSKFEDSKHVSVWLCRDVDNKKNALLKKDCLRWFSPIDADGTYIKDWKK